MRACRAAGNGHVPVPPGPSKSADRRAACLDVQVRRATWNSAPFAANLKAVGAPADSIEKPKCRRPSIMTRVSSLSRTPSSVEVPSASAAVIKARLVKLLEPGGRIETSGATASGRISIRSGKVVQPRGHARLFSFLACHGVDPWNLFAIYLAAIFHKCRSLRTSIASFDTAGEH